MEIKRIYIDGFKNLDNVNITLSKIPKNAKWFALAQA